MPDMNTSHWTVRLEAARDAAKRTRLAFLAVTVISVAIGIAEFNSSLSWYFDVLRETITSSTANNPQPTTSTSTSPASNTPPTNSTSSTSNALSTSTNTPSAADEIKSEFHKGLAQAILKGNRVTVSLLGVDFGMSDAAPLGSIALWILAVWFFFSARRENHLVGKLLSDAARENNFETRSMIFHGTASQMVFLSITRSDDPIDRLEAVAPPEAPPFELRLIVSVLFYLPVFTIAFIFIMDILSLWLFTSPLRPAGEPLWRQLAPATWVKFAFWQGIALTFGTATFYSCYGVFRFERATAAVLREFHRNCLTQTRTGA